MKLGSTVAAGVLLPSAILFLFLLLLCNDKGVLGPWCNKLSQNVVTTLIIGVLVVLSMILVVNTLFKSIDVPTLTRRPVKITQSIWG